MSLFSGHLETSKTTSDGRWNIGKMKNGNMFQQLSEYCTHTYIGADNPLVEFENDHFKISFLHNTEMTGQDDFDAGITPPANETATQVSEKSSIPIYRINKRLPPIQYTPDAKPYSDAEGVQFGNSKIVLMNENIVPWRIIDSHSGISIDDWGYEK